MGLRSALQSAFKGLDVAPGGDTPATYGGLGGSGQWPWLAPSSRVDYKTEAGDLTQNAILMACLAWICRTFPEAPLRVVTTNADGQLKPVPNHPLQLALEMPNPFYNGLLLWQATLLSWNLDGNGYWLLGRNGYGAVEQIWYEPHTTIKPVWPDDGSTFVSGYKVLRRGVWKPVAVEDVVHFRNGLDPLNPRMGLSPVKSALREVFTDNEAATFTASLLRNMGVPGMVLSPADSSSTIDDPEGLKKVMISKFSGDKRGEPLVMETPIKIEQLAWSPEQLNLDKLRSIPEERITALLGLPAIVAGLGAGLDHSTYNNYAEAKASAYENNLLPTQRLLAAQLKIDLLPIYGNPKKESVDFDISKVQALSDDKDKLYLRISTAWKTGWLLRKDARLLSGENLPIDDERDNVYYTDLVAKASRITESEPSGTLLADDGEKPPKETDPTDPEQPIDDSTDPATQATDATSKGRQRKAHEPATTEGRLGAVDLTSAFARLMDELEARR